MLVFPGRGQSAEAVEKFRSLDRFPEYYEIVCDTLGADLDTCLRKDTNSQGHTLHCLLIILQNALTLNEFEQHSGTGWIGASGYSVGQWSALHAVGALTFSETVTLVHHRAQLLEQAAQQEPGDMVAVIGVRRGRLEQLCKDLRGAGLAAYIANENAPGHHTLACGQEAKERLLKELQGLNPLKLVELKVGGPWHCPLMQTARDQFQERLKSAHFQDPKVPVLDNLTARPLPSDPSLWATPLADHLNQRVRWQSVVEAWKERGARRFLELGPGQQLSQLGFFIDRSLDHQPYWKESLS